MEESILISEMLDLAIEPISTNHLLKRMINIVERITWLKTDGRGRLFLVNKSKFVVAATYGFAGDLSPFSLFDMNGCACAADMNSLKAGIFSCQHAHLQPENHHYMLPLVVKNKTLGIVAIFVSPEQALTHKQQAFLDKFAAIASNATYRLMTDEIVELHEFELEESRIEVINMLGIVAEYRDTETGKHVLRVKEYSAILAMNMGLSRATQQRIRTVVALHDIGKIAIPDNILLKPGKLTAEEFAMMKTHTVIGHDMLTGDNEFIVDARSVVLTHHEKWDGSGYPKGLRGTEIPLFGRICALSDVFDALTSDRPYKKAWAVTDAVALIKQESGTHFDPDIVDAFVKALPDILRAKEFFRDDVIDPLEKLNLPPVEPRDNNFFSWDDSFSVNIDAIDEHHRFLFELINIVYHAVVQGNGSKEVRRALQALLDYSNVHFEAEETLMQQFNLAHLQAHKALHNEFRNKIDDFLIDFKSNPLALGYETVLFLKNWLIDHVKVEDQHLRDLTISK